MPRLILIVALWLSLHGESQLGPRIMRKLWSKLTPNHALNFREQIAELRERTDRPKGKRTEVFFRASEELKSS